MKPWVAWPKTAGVCSRQAHADMPDGTYEREMGKEGFSGPATHLHHRHPPTSWSSIEGPLAPRAFDGNQLLDAADCPFSSPRLFYNNNTQVRLWRAESSMQHLVRNGDGDELLFIHQGQGEFYCDFGHMTLVEGDYINIPRGTMWRIETSSQQPMMVLMIEATGESFTLPEKGLLGEHALFDPAMMDVPELDNAFKAQQSETETLVRVKRDNAYTNVTYPFNPLDAIGWHGTLLPARINWRDFRPVTSHRYHLPPSIHSTFVSERFIVTTFCPRPVESDPGALKLPFYHNNNDYDEVIFYHCGQFLSRDTIGAGMLTFHPMGLTHGPHPNAYDAALRAERKQTDEVAVMIDARDPLMVDEGIASSIEIKNYANSWHSD